MKPLNPEKRYLFPDDYMADPSVHVFNGRIYIYPSHDWECENVENDNGDQYVMKDMHVLSIDGDPMTGKVTDHGKALDIADIPWAGRQLWDCDCNEKDGKYYFSYSTGDSHLLCYAIGDNPYGPFVYQGVILTPVVGWTTHHCIIEYNGKWYLFHHDSVPSGGKSWLRSLKVCELTYDADGHILPIDGGGESAE